MKRKFNIIYSSFAILLMACLFLSNSNNPPNGRTGAPGDGLCSDCHGGSNPNGFTGSITITGIGTNIAPNTTYPIVVTITNPSSAASKAGFQLLVLNGTSNCGDLLNPDANTTTTIVGAKEYAEHNNGAKSFGTATAVSYTFDWKSPATVSNGNNINFYMAGLIGNGSGSSGDLTVTNLVTSTFVPVVSTIAVSISNAQNETCNTSNDGSATASASAATGTVSYAWSNGNSGATINNLNAGTYTVTATDSNGSATATVSITQPTAITVTTIGQTAATCDTGGSATVSASGGTPGYSYLWPDGTSTATATDLASGSYSITVTDDNGCTKVHNVFINSSVNLPTVTIATPSTLTCNTPSIMLNAVGSSTGSSFVNSWTTAAGGSIVSGASSLTPTINAPGVYILSIINTTNGCGATASVNVLGNTTPPNLTATGGVVTCATPITTVSANSTSPGVVYIWAGPNGFSTNSATANVSAVGIYTVTATASSGCSTTATASVTQNISIPNITATGAILNCLLPTTNISATSSSPNAAFAWLGPNGFTASGSTVAANAVGTYTVAVLATNGCSNSTTVSVVGDLNVPTLSISSDVNALTCANTSAVLTASGNGISYLWANLATTPSITVNTAGTYIVGVVGTNGCSTSTSITVAVNNSAPEVNINPSNAVLNCTNNNVTLVASSNASNVTYNWFNNTTTSSIQAASAGNYTITITNTDNACSATAVATVTQDASLPDVSITGSNVLTCVNSSTQLAASSTNADVIFSWQGPNNFNANGATVTATEVGEYSVTASAANGCVATTSVLVTSDSNVPAVVFNNNTPTVDCNNTSVIVSATGGDSYIWSNDSTGASVTLGAGTYTVTATAANGCTTSASLEVVADNVVPIINALTNTTLTCTQSSISLNAELSDTYTYTWNVADGIATAAGVYTVTATATNGCQTIANVNITSNTDLPDVSISSTNTVLSCAVPLLYLTGASTTPNVMYDWNVPVNNENPVYVTMAGIYTLTVTNTNNGCTNTASIEVTVANDAPVVTIESATITCYNSMVALATSSPNNDLQYAWTGPDNFTDSVANPSVSAAGFYILTVTDATGCSAVFSTEVLIDAQPPIAVANVEGELNCTVTTLSLDGVGSSEGANFGYSWETSGGNIMSGGNTLNPTINAAGVYQLTVLDSTNGCFNIALVEVTESLPFSILPEADIETPLCNGDNNGSLAINVSGGTPPLSYDWNTGATGDVLLDIASGVYTVTVMDGSGCAGVASFEVAEPAVLSVTSDVTNATDGNSNGSIALAITGGTAPYTTLWSSGTGENLAAGAYSCTITDANACFSIIGPIEVDNISAVQDLDEIALSIMPNPASDELRVYCQVPNRTATIRLYNAFGELIFNASLTAVDFENPYYRMDTSLLPSGYYSVSITSASKVVTKPVVIIAKR